MIRKLLTLIFLLLTISVLQAQSHGQMARQLYQRIQKIHYAPRPCNDSLSETLMDAFLKEIDPLQVYFMAEDVTALGRHRKSLDDYILGGDGGFIEEVKDHYKRGLRRSDSIVKVLCSAPLDFKQSDRYIDTDREDNAWAQTPAELAQQWRRLLKERVLSLIFNRHTDSTGYRPDQLASLMAHEPEMRELVLRRSENRLAKRLENADKFIGGAFLKCLALQFDPHTEFFDLSEQKEFLAQLSTQKESFGLSLDENAAGEVEVSRIVPGSPAWKSGKLNAGDILISFSPGNGQEIEVEMSSAAEISSRMAESDTDSMCFTVRKKDGQTLTACLAKATLRADENLVKSFVIEGKQKVGYIQLPGFYQDWEAEGGRGCAGDVAKELIKLQKDGIQALILDLRFNGGGSLTEATDLAGIFIDGGSLWISRNSANERFTIKDPNRGSAYAGPMMVLVNGASASASEFLCSALQDHRRAIIVGSTTFGKATSQAFYPIDPRATDPNGFVKITSHKYYRLQGNSHQFTGVQPDIVLPDPWARFIEGEGTLPWAIQPDTVLKKTYYTPLQLPDLGALQRQSTARCAQNAAFKELDEIAGQLKALLEAQKSLALNGAAWFGWEEQRRKLLSKLDELEKERPDAAFTLHSSQFDAAFLQVDEYSRNLKEEMMQTLRKDLQLGECLHIIEDVLHP